MIYNGKDFLANAIIFDSEPGGYEAEISPWSEPREINLILMTHKFIIAQIFPKEVIPGASARLYYSQEVLKPRWSEGLGKARIPMALDEAGEDRLGKGLHAVNSF